MLKNKLKDKSFVIASVLTIILIACAALLYFINLDYDTALVNDEHQSFSVAWNLLNGNGLVRSDFLSSYAEPKSYTRGWPSTYLLAGWMKLFGTSEYTCRALSALYGVLFVISMLYITYKMVHNYMYSLMATFMMLGVYDVAKYFRTIRMYSLELVISIWLYYIAYRFITGENRFWKKREQNTNKILFYICKCFDYDWIYFPVFGILAFLCFENFVNGVILLGGVALFVVVQAIVKREAKYVFATLAGGFGCVLSAINLIYYFSSGKFLFATKVFKKFVYYFGFKVQPGYLKTILACSGNYLLGAAMIVVLIAACIYLKKIEMPLIYILSINVFTVIFYCFFSAGRYTFHTRYILDLIPWATMCFAFVVLYLYEIRKVVGMLAGSALIALAFIHYGHFLLIYSQPNPTDTDYYKAYSSASEYYDLDHETVPIVQSYMRSWYSTKVFNDIEYKAMSRKKSFDDWYSFIDEYPEGIVTAETIKVVELTQDVQKIMSDWTDVLSGRDFDGSGVEVSHYCFINENQSEAHNTTTGAYAGDAEITIVFDNTSLEEVRKVSDSPSVVFVSLDISVGEETVTRYFGLMFESSIENADVMSWDIASEHLKNINVSEISSVKVNSAVGIYADHVLNDEHFIY